MARLLLSALLITTALEARRVTGKRYSDLRVKEPKLETIPPVPPTAGQARKTLPPLQNAAKLAEKAAKLQNAAKLAEKVANLWKENREAQGLDDKISLDVVSNYAAKCLAGYKNVAYHHAEHAVDVFEFIVTVFWKSDKLTGAQKKALALAAVCHDFGHPGLNNNAVFNFKKIEKLLDSSERSALEAVYEASNPADLVSSAAGKKGGAYCASSSESLLPCKPYFISKGCAGDSGEEGSCSSLEETYHASKAVEFLESEASSNMIGLVRKYILATDFGKDYFLRTEVNATLEGKTPKLGDDLAGELAIHISDINAACKKNFLWWSAGVMAEFIHQGIIGLAVGDPFFAPIKYTLKDLAKGQQEWSEGIVAWFTQGVPIVGDGAANAIGLPGHPQEDAIGSHYDQLVHNINAWKACADEVDDVVLSIPTDNAKYKAFGDLKNAAGDKAEKAKSLLNWSQLEIRDAIIEQAMTRCGIQLGWDVAVGLAPTL